MAQSIHIFYTINTGLIGGNYQLLKVFTEESFFEINQKSFNKLEELANYAIDLLEEHDLSKAYLLANDEFNNALESSVKDKSEFMEVFKKYATPIEFERQKSKDSILKRFFS